MKTSDWYVITGLLCMAQISYVFAAFATALAFVITLSSIYEEKP